MNTTRRIVVAMGFAAGLLAEASGAPPVASTAAVATVTFEGTSTLHDFHGTAESDPAELAVEPAAGGRVWSAAVRVPAARLSTDHRKRDANMFKMLETGLFPAIAGRIERAPVPADAPQPVDLLLELHGTNHAVKAEVGEWRETPDLVEFRLSFPVSLAAFNLRAPSVMGMIRVGDEVRVTCHVRAPRAAGRAAPE